MHDIYMARGNPIYVQANTTSRHAVSIRQSTWFYCTPYWLLAESYLLSLVPSSFLSLGTLFFVICTPNRAELQYYGNSSGGSSGSRKSQINPFVIPHRSFQPVRISTTRFYATSAPSRNSSLFSSAPLPSCQERTALSSPSLHLFFSSRLTLPYFRHFSFSPLFLVPLLHLS